MINLSLLGIPNDDNSSSMKGPADAPALIRRELYSDAYSLWSETGIDLGASGTIVTMATSRSTTPATRGMSSNAMWGAPWHRAIP